MIYETSFYEHLSTSVFALSPYNSLRHVLMSHSTDFGQWFRKSTTQPTIVEKGSADYRGVDLYSFYLRQTRSLLQ